MGKREGPQICFCESCNGKLVTASEWAIHKELARTESLQALESAIARVALVDPPPPRQQRSTTDASVPATPSSRKSAAKAQAPATAQSPSSHNHSANEVYRELWHRDVEMHNRLGDVEGVLQEWSHSSKFPASFQQSPSFLTRRDAHRFLDGEELWLRETTSRMKSLLPSQDHANQLLISTMIAKAEDGLARISETTRKWAWEEENLMQTQDFFNNGTGSLMVAVPYSLISPAQSVSFCIHFEPAAPLLWRLSS
jgi:hypothetical protein